MIGPIRSLRTRLLLGAAAVLGLVMAGVGVIVEHRQRATIVEEFQRRGEVLARNLAAISQGPLLLYNFTALEQNVARVGAEADVRYAIVLDAEGKVAAHSRRPERVGVVLPGALDERAARTETLLMQATVDGETGEAVDDFALPVVVGGQRWGTVRVGLSRRRLEAELHATRLEVAAVGALALGLGAAAAGLLARRIAGPVQELERRADAIARGELDQRIAPLGADELGRLAEAFNRMAAQLAQQRAALEEVHAELEGRFEELADLKSYTDSILASVSCAIVTVDLEGRIVTLNQAAELLTGYFAGEAAGRYCTEVFAQSPELAEVLMETLATRAPIANVPLTLRRRNGTSCPAELSTSPLRRGDGKELGAVAVLRDLSLVRQLETRLRRSDQLAALGTLAAGLAHEIKNPLTSLLTFSRHLSRRFDDVQFRERFLSVVPRELERINEIVERLLELARPAQLTLRPVRLAALLDRVVDLYAGEIEAKAIAVIRRYARDVPPIHADEEALYRAFVNLVANAVEAMDEGGRLTLRLDWCEPERLRARRAVDRRVVVEVEDTGPGVPAAAGDQIFTPFFTTKPGGTGLGLAIVHKIVEDHGGAIDFRSAAGLGTCFRVTLPLAPGGGTVG